MKYNELQYVWVLQRAEDRLGSMSLAVSRLTNIRNYRAKSFKNEILSYLFLGNQGNIQKSEIDRMIIL